MLSSQRYGNTGGFATALEASFLGRRTALGALRHRRRPSSQLGNRIGSLPTALKVKQVEALRQHSPVLAQSSRGKGAPSGLGAAHDDGAAQCQPTVVVGALSEPPVERSTELRPVCSP